jgi:hypothetical protein
LSDKAELRATAKTRRGAELVEQATATIGSLFQSKHSADAEALEEVEQRSVVRTLPKIG